jgi:hypothetical protein
LQYNSHCGNRQSPLLNTPFPHSRRSHRLDVYNKWCKIL